MYFITLYWFQQTFLLEEFCQPTTSSANKNHLTFIKQLMHLWPVLSCAETLQRNVPNKKVSPYVLRMDVVTNVSTNCQMALKLKPKYCRFYKHILESLVVTFINLKFNAMIWRPCRYKQIHMFYWNQFIVEITLCLNCLFMTGVLFL